MTKKKPKQHWFSLDSLEDEAFDSVVSMVMKKRAVKEDKKDKKEKEDEAEAEVEEAEATAEVFEEVETSEATLVEPAVDEADELESTRAGLSEWIGANILNK